MSPDRPSGLAYVIICHMAGFLFVYNIAPHPRGICFVFTLAGCWWLAVKMTRPQKRKHLVIFTANLTIDEGQIYGCNTVFERSAKFPSIFSVWKSCCLVWRFAWQNNSYAAPIFHASFFTIFLPKSCFKINEKCFWNVNTTNVFCWTYLELKDKLWCRHTWRWSDFSSNGKLPRFTWQEACYISQKSK